MGSTFKLDKYITEARTKPFDLEISDHEVLSIPVPDGDTMLEIEESRSSRATLELLCGEHFERVMDLVGPQPVSVLNALVQDMLRHFGITPEQAPPGGSRASRRS